MAYNRNTHLHAGTEIKIALAKARLFQGDAAEKIGMTRQAFTNKISGKRLWTQEEKEKLAQLLNETTDALFPGEINNSVSDTQAESPLPLAANGDCGESRES